MAEIRDMNIQIIDGMAQQGKLKMYAGVSNC